MIFDEICSLLTEAPYAIDNLDYKRDDSNSPLYRNVKDGKIIGNVNLFGKEVSVLKQELYKGWNKFWFKYQENPIAFYSGLETPDNKIITTMTYTKPGFVEKDSLLGEIYVKFLLQNYNAVVSDSALTQYGFKFWKNNFEKFTKNGFKVNLVEVDFYDGNPQYIETFKNSKDMDEFYNEKSGKYRFEVSR